MITYTRSQTTDVREKSQQEKVFPGGKQDFLGMKTIIRLWKGAKELNDALCLIWRTLADVFHWWNLHELPLKALSDEFVRYLRSYVDICSWAGKSDCRETHDQLSIQTMFGKDGKKCGSVHHVFFAVWSAILILRPVPAERMWQFKVVYMYSSDHHSVNEVLQNRTRQRRSCSRQKAVCFVAPGLKMAYSLSLSNRDAHFVFISDHCSA